MLPSDKRLGVVGGDRCPAARFSCDADDRAGPPFRLALRHGSHAESLTLGKSCENPVGRSDRPSGDGAGIAPPWSQQLLWRRPSGRRSRRPWCHVSQALGRNRPRGRPTRAGCSSRSADPSGSRCSPSGSTDRRELRCQIVAKGARAAAPSLWCEGHRRVSLPAPPHEGELQTPNATTRAWLSARSGPRTTVSAPNVGAIGTPHACDPPCCGGAPRTAMGRTHVCIRVVSTREDSGVVARLGFRLRACGS